MHCRCKLFRFRSSIQAWVFKNDKHAPAATSGMFACVLSTTTIVVLCFLRGLHEAPPDNPLAIIAAAPRDFATGLLVASLVPSGIAASKVIGIYASLRRMPEDERKPEGLGLAIGAGLLGLVNLAGSVATLILFFAPRS
jgi:hypothetical protein